jgi:hypothetical protein
MPRLSAGNRCRHPRKPSLAEPPWMSLECWPDGPRAPTVSFRSRIREPLFGAYSACFAKRRFRGPITDWLPV